MRADIYWISEIPYGRLAIMPRPRSGDWLEDELMAWKTAGIEVVVSLLTSPEIIELGLQNEEKCCESIGIQYISYPIPDRQVPSAIPPVSSLIQNIDTWLKEGKVIAIHCRAGIGRSALLAACTLVVQGLTPDSAFQLITKARGVQVPDTDEQRLWVERFSKHLNTE